MNNIKAILKQINNIILLLDTKGQVQYVSPSVKNILGFQPEELSGDNWWLRTSVNVDIDSIKASVLDHLEKSVSYGGIQSERLVKTSYGSEKWFLWNTSVAPDGMILSIGTDITDKKKKETELSRKTVELSERNEEIQDSLDYAKRLQEVILPDEDSFTNFFQDAFLYFVPKDKVSGDFYWYYENEESVFVAAVDCTGHGVPGALLSVVGNSLLREIIIRKEITQPSEILKELDEGLLEAMSKKNELQARDGMDIALIKVDKTTRIMEFSGAYRPIILLSDELTELQASRYPIGFYHDVDKKFEEYRIALKSGDRIYLFSDGITDQFGGPFNKKFKKTQLKDIVYKTRDFTLSEQKDYIQYAFRNWQQSQPQTDDVLLIGLEI